MGELKSWSSRFVPLAMGLAVALPVGLIVSANSEANSEPASIRSYNDTVLPLLEKHCFECHGDGYDKGKIAFDQLETPIRSSRPTSG